MMINLPFSDCAARWYTTAADMHVKPPTCYIAENCRKSLTMAGDIRTNFDITSYPVKCQRKLTSLTLRSIRHYQCPLKVS